MSKKLWGGGFSQTASVKREEFWNSIGFDQRLAKFDIQGSMAHARMLGACGIVPEDDVAKIIGGLTSILDDLNSGNLEFRLEDEDIHMNIASGH